MRLRLTLVLVVLLSGSVHVAAQVPEWYTEFVVQLDRQNDSLSFISETPTAESWMNEARRISHYFRNRPAEQDPWIITIPKDSAVVRFDWADRAIDHIITTRAGSEAFGDTLPWFSPDKQLNTLSRFEHFEYLVPAYYLSGNEAYAAAIVRDMLDFVDHAPIEKAARFTVQDDPRWNPFNWVLTQWRIVRWIDALYYLRESPSLTEESHLRILNHMWKEIDWLVPRVMLGLHNGTLGNLRTLIYSGITYPEHRNGGNWLSYGADFFRFFLASAFYPGEFLVELTLGYSEGTLLMCTMIYEGLPEEWKARLREPYERIVEAHVGMMKPDRSLPRYGDHGAYDIRDRLLVPAGRLLDRPDFQSLVNDTPLDPPAFLSFPKESNPYYLSGYYAMRDSWDTRGQYFAMDAGPYGTNHQHSDKLSIVVSADSADFIVDPGTSLYRSNLPGPRYDLRYGFLHNVITLDGVDPNTGWDRHYGFDVLPNRWVTNERYDFLEGTYEFRNNLIDVIWRRSVWYGRSEYWIVLDALLGKGEHFVESNFQFAPGTEITFDGYATTAGAPNGANLQMDTLPDGLDPRVVKGDTTLTETTYLVQYPMHVDWISGGRGWVGSFGNESPIDPTRNLQAPAVVFEGKVELPHYSLRILTPSKDKKTGEVQATWLAQESDYLSWRIDQTTSGTSDFWQWWPAQRTDPRTPLEDDRGVFYRVRNGAIEEIHILNSREIDIQLSEETVTLGFSGPMEGYLVATDTGYTLFVDKFLRAPIEFEYGSGSHVSTGNFSLTCTDINGDPADQLRPGNWYILTRDRP